MKNKLTLASFWIRALVALLAVTAFLPASRAQTPQRHVENRVLLVFDTSYPMKKRVPAELMGIGKLFALTFSSQLQTGDSIGVWTFEKDVQMGALPLQHWSPEAIDNITSNVLKVVEKHHYNRDTSFEKLVPALERVMSVSPRLTTLVFCDGEAPIHGTPYDDEINRMFKQHESAMSKDREPYVLVFRTEYSRFVGSTINTADNINVPQFPLPPAPPPPPPVPPPAPVSTVPPLIIIGNSVGTNVPPPTPAPAREQTPPPVPAQAPVVTSNATSLVVIMPPAHPATNEAAPETNPAPAAVEEAPTNVTPPPEVVSPPPAPPVTNFTATAIATETPEGPITHAVLLAIGGGILVIVVVGGFMISRRARRRNKSSLITESLKKK